MDAPLGLAAARHRPLATPAIRVEGISKRFSLGKQALQALDSVSFEVSRGSTHALVGESGSGKSQTAFALMGLLAANGRIGGSATFNGRQILNLPERELNKLRAEQISMIFQDPMTSLNPYMRVGEQLMEVL
ncbi:ATP-binding cassette domain-containing protein, partial [Pseudomonas aeruginosa]|nr:ATP-binding cassette domain-containing protein [Pseudomonas aeruginosa]